MQQRSHRFITALEGVRGYAFLVVFLVHYDVTVSGPTHLWFWPFFMLKGLGWLVIPVFFALSGYLITGILLDTKGRDGYFRVFYGRRSLRVFPLYYLVLLSVAVAAWIQHWNWNLHYLAYLCYLQNFSNHAGIFSIGKYVLLGHLWSLAVEEHFYLVWPVVIWLCPSRSWLLRTCYAIVAMCFLLRLCWPMFHVSMMAGYWSTFTRADGIVGGAIIAVMQRDKGLSRRVVRMSEWFCLAGLAILSARTMTSGSSAPMDYFDLVLMTPLANVMAAAMLIVLISSDTLLSRICSHPWICNVGKKSYGLYVFHNLYFGYFFYVVAWKLTPRMGGLKAQFVSALMALGLTWVLASAAYRWIEEPAMRLKSGLKYGPTAQPKATIAFSLPVPVYMAPRMKPRPDPLPVPVMVARTAGKQDYNLEKVSPGSRGFLRT